MTYRIITEVNGLGEIHHFVEKKEVVREAGWFFKEKANWCRESKFSRTHLGYNDIVFGSKQAAKDYIDAELKESFDAKARATITSTVVEGYP